MDIALVLDKIRPGAAWRNASSYEALEATWEDEVQTLPSEAELEEAWVSMQTEAIPDWQGLSNTFSFPGNSLYASVVGKVAQAGYETQDHWQNFKMALSAHNMEVFAAAVQHLAALLLAAGHPASETDKEDWNVLVEAHGFPDSCKLT